MDTTQFFLVMQLFILNFSVYQMFLATVYSSDKNQQNVGDERFMEEVKDAKSLLNILSCPHSENFH